MKNFIIFICLILFCQKASAQYISLQGKVIEAKSGISIANCNIELMSLQDTSYYSIESALDGKFRIFAIKQFGKYLLMAHKVGYAKYLKVITLSDNSTDIGKIKMLDSMVLLKETVIKSQRNGFIIKGDTVEYNAKSFKTSPDMDAVYFLNKLPGVDMSGDMKVDGDSVSKVSINGIICFGEKPKKMLENLPASVIEKIQIYNDLTDEERKDSVKKISTSKAINIVTNKDYFSKPRGKMYAAYSNNNLHLAGGNILSQKKDEQISLSTSTNKGRIKNSNYFDPASQFWSSGIPTENDVSFELTKNVSKKTKINLSAGWYGFTNDVKSTSLTNYTTDNVNSGRIQNENIQHTRNSNPSARLRIEYKIDSLKKLTITIGSRMSHSNNLSDFLTLDYTKNNANRNQFNTTSNSINYTSSNEITYLNNFKNSKKSFQSILRFGLNNSESENISTGETIRADTNAFNYKNMNNNKTKYVEPEISFKHSLNKYSTLNYLLNTNYRLSNFDQTKYDYSYALNDYTLLDTSLFKQITTTTSLSKFQLNYSYNINKVKIDFSNSLLYLTINADNFSSKIFSRNYVLPNSKLSFQYQFSKAKDIIFDISKWNDAPGYNELNPILLNSNKSNMSIGNLTLKPAEIYYLTASYKSKNSSTGSFFSVSTTFSFNHNLIRQNLLIASSDTLYYHEIPIAPGTQLSYYDNIKNYGRQSIRISYDFPLKMIKSILKTRCYFEHYKNNSSINYISNYSTTNSISPAVTIISTISTKIDFTIFLGYNLQLIHQLTNYNIQDYKLNAFLTYEFLKNSYLKFESNSNAVKGLNNSQTNQFSMLDISLEKNFLKNAPLKISVLAHDIFNSYKNYDYENRVNYSVERHNNNVGKYFLLKLGYTF